MCYIKVGKCLIFDRMGFYAFTLSYQWKEYSLRKS